MRAFIPHPLTSTSPLIPLLSPPGIAEKLADNPPGGSRETCIRDAASGDADTVV